MLNVTIRTETPDDYDAIREVNREAFGQDNEGRLVDALRKEKFARLSLVAVDAKDVVAGHILFSRIKIISDDQSIDALSLAPMAVVPTFQRQGIGSQLIDEGLRRCREVGERIVIVLGHAEYYPRFGFSSALATNLMAPLEVPTEAWMALELSPDALADIEGRVVYPPPFAEV